MGMISFRVLKVTPSAGRSLAARLMATQMHPGRGAQRPPLHLLRRVRGGAGGVPSAARARA
eukprot:6320718-Pyramimonas_sp.AAC.3